MEHSIPQATQQTSKPSYKLSTGRRRFAPALLSTVKDSFRLPSEHKRPGPAPELTPEPSPIEEVSPPLDSLPFPEKDSQTQTKSEPSTGPQSTSTSVSRKKRRFAPQLIETSRRCRRSGDTSPATKPADKTDISPWISHIYSPKPRRRFVGLHEHQEPLDSLTPIVEGTTAVADDYQPVERNDGDLFSRNPILSRRESNTSDGLRRALEYVRDEYSRAQQKREHEVLMAAFPNYKLAAHEGVEHFHAREISCDDIDSKEGAEGRRAQRRHDSEFNWFTKEHQLHALELARARGEEPYYSHDEDTLVESRGGERPGAPPIWATDSKQQPEKYHPLPPPGRGPMGEFVMPLIPETHITPFIPSRPTPLSVTPTKPQARSSAIRPIGERFMPYIPTAPVGMAADMPYVPASTPFSRSPGPLRTVGFQNAANTTRNHVKVVTPPMAGADLKFRRYESPQTTKIEPDRPFYPQPGAEPHRDTTGRRGLWMGYCCAKDSKELVVPSELQGPHMIATPHPPSSPYLAPPTPIEICDEPTGMWLPPNKSLCFHSSQPELQPQKNPELRGVRLVAGLDDRAKHEREMQEKAELEEKIAEEFDDAFVTQVYNYLSLGCPIVARDFDHELSHITGMAEEELCKTDTSIMFKGNMKFTMAADEKDENRGPRWHALKKYILEWARQHQDLSFDGPDPVHWGMRERRGSWAI